MSKKFDIGLKIVYFRYRKAYLIQLCGVIMTFKEKNVLVTLVSFGLIFLFFIIRIFQLLQNDAFVSSKVFQVWGIVVILAVVATIIAMILTHGTLAAFQAIRAKGTSYEYDESTDERDTLIDLKGTNITYTVSSIGVFCAMLTYVFSQPPLIMFSLLIFFGLLAQIVGDIARLMLQHSHPAFST